MSSRNISINKVFGLAIVILILIGTLTPAYSVIGGETNEDSSSRSDELFSPTIIGNTWYIDGHETLEGSPDRDEFPLDANIQINDSASLTINDATLSLLIDGFHPWRITLMDNAELTLNNATITTTMRGEGLLRPFLKTNVSAFAGSSINMYDNSSFQFPGWVYLENSELNMVNSRFEPLEHVPEFDYTWGESERSIGIEDNNDCPRLIASDGSYIHLEDSEINNQYRNNLIGHMEWEPDSIDGDYHINEDGHIVIEAGGNIEVDVWEYMNPRFPGPDRYPYFNPFNRISALYIEMDYRTGENYTANDPVEYETPEETKEAFNLERRDSFGTDGAEIFETSISTFGNDGDRFIKNLTVNLFNHDDPDDNQTDIFIRSFRMFSAFDNDIHIWNSEMVAINSVIDVDFNPSDVDPRPGFTQATDNTNWMANADQDHRVIRLLEGSTFRGYGFQPTDLEPQPDGDPIFVTDGDSGVEIYRWATVTPKDLTGTPISGTNITFSKGALTYNNPDENPEALDYLERNFGVIYDSTNGHYVTDHRGQTTMFLRSDNITHPEDWPNSEYTGEYTLQAIYEDPERGVDLNETARSISFSAFPNFDEEANHMFFDLGFDMEIPHPDLTISEEDIHFQVDGNPVTYVTNETEVTIEVTVHNIGTLEAEDVLIHYYIEDEGAAPAELLPPDVIKIGESTIDYIDEGDSVQTNITWTPELPGLYEIFVYVDPYEDIIELDDTNNVASNTLWVGEKANLYAEGVFFLPSDEVVNGTHVEIYSEIVNYGGTDVHDVEVAFYLGDEYGDLIGTSVIDIPGNGTRVMTEPIHWEYPGPGNYDITVVADPDGLVDRVHTDMNKFTNDISIYTEPDFEIDYLNISSDEVYDGEELTIYTMVSNVGEWTSSQTDVRFYVDHGTDHEEFIGSVTVPSLQGGESTEELSMDWTANMVESELSEVRTITAVVNEDYDEELEVNRDNNYADVDVEIMNPAELSIMPEDITFDTELAEVDEQLTIFAEVYNHGGEDVTITVRFFEGEEVIGEDVITVEAEGESATASVSWTPTRRGNHEIRVVVDPDEEIYEVDRRFNEASVIKPIFSDGLRHDLIVDGNDVETRGSYRSSGYVVVMDGGELTIRGEGDRASFEMTQSRDNQYSIIVRDQGRLVIENTMIFSDYDISIIVSDSATLEVIDDGILYDMVKLEAVDDCLVNIEDSSIRGPVEISSGTFRTHESQFTSTDTFISPSEIYGVNTTFESNLDDFHDTTGALTAVQTDSITMTGDSEIDILIWLRAHTVSQGNIPLGGTRVEINSLNIDYSASGITDDQGSVYLPALTNILTPGADDYVGNYEIEAEYVWGEMIYSFGPITEPFPGYTDGQYLIERTLRFEDLMIPDLAITDGDVHTDVDDVASGEQVRITVEVHNLGMADAEDVNVEFYLIGPEDEELIDIYTIDGIQSMESETAEIYWTASLSDTGLREEVRQIRVWVNPDVSPLPDPQLDNNEAFTQVTVRAVPMPEFYSDDVIITVDGSPIENNTVLERDDLDISVHVVNNGGTIMRNATIEFFYNGETIGQNITDMPVDEVLNITEPWTATVTGEVTIEVVLYASDGNLTVSRNIIIEEMTPMFIGISIPLDDMDMGEPFTVLGDLVRSVDEKPISGMTVRAQLIDEDGTTVDEGTAVTGDGGSFVIDLVTPDRGGDFYVRLTPDHPRGEELDTQQFSVIDPAEGIPLWMFALIIVVVVAGGLVGMILYLKYKGEGEWVECGECGSTIPAESTSCPKCNTEFEMGTVKCSECGEWISGDAAECPHCGVEFITTGKDVEDYSESMKRQYEAYVEKNKRWAREELGDKFTEEEFMEWWSEQPSYLTFDDWLEQEEARRKKGGVECPQCDALNSVDDALCQKCGTTLIQFTQKTEEEEEEEEEMPLLGLDDIEKLGDEEEPEEEMEEDEEPERKVVKKVKKRPKRVAKRVKKKVVKKPDEEE